MASILYGEGNHTLTMSEDFLDSVSCFFFLETQLLVPRILIWSFPPRLFTHFPRETDKKHKYHTWT